jgi:hypothetical protein
MVIPGTLDRLSHTIHVLQQLQRLLTISATLEDVADLLACIEAEYGSECLLENVIQHLEGEHLAIQLAQRKAARRSALVELEVAA